MVVTGGGVGEPPGPEQPRVQVTPRAVLVVMLNTLALLGGCTCCGSCAISWSGAWLPCSLR
jgi:hypothetical protein